MKKERLDVTRAIRSIQNLVKDLLNLFLYCKSIKELVEKLKIDLQVIDDANPEYYEMIHDSRETTRMNIRLAILLLSLFIDFFLLYGALVILCDIFNLPGILKLVVPAALITLEIAISYSSILQARDETRSSRIAKNLQYFVLPILVGFSVFSLFFHFQSFNPEIDGASLLSYMTFDVIFQCILLISAFMLHIWIINSAEEIAEAVAYLKYRYDRRQIENKIERLERGNSSIYFPRFVKLTHKFVSDTEGFHARYTDVNVNFTSAMPLELKDAVNRVMGRPVLGSEIVNIVR